MGASRRVGWARGRRVWGRPLPIFLIVLEKACSVLGIGAGAALGLILVVRGDRNPLRSLLPREWAESPRDAWMGWLVHHVPAVPPGMAALLALALVLWAGLLGAEAVGLWLELGWGEFLVILEAALFLPLEAWHLARRPAGSGALALAANVAVALYIGALYRRRVRARQRGRDAAPG